MQVGAIGVYMFNVCNMLACLCVRFEILNGMEVEDYLVWTFFTRPSRSTWPAAYCSITSFTSYGFKASLNFRRATKYFICWVGRMGVVELCQREQSERRTK